jgi:hypothetical protein
MKKVLVLAIALTLVLSVAAMAGPGQNALNKIAIHVKAHPTSCTKSYPTFPTCTSIVYTWPGLGDIDVMPVNFDLVGYTLVEFGVIWPEAAWGTASFTRCKGDLAIGTIQHSADNPLQDNSCGVAIAWSTCQNTWSVASGFAWLIPTTPGRICPAPSGNGGAWGTVDCTLETEGGPWYQSPIAGYCAGVGGMLGDDPCIPPSATDQSTWGNIKSIFK